jgi:hypothetical protein
MTSELVTAEYVGDLMDGISLATMIDPEDRSAVELAIVLAVAHGRRCATSELAASLATPVALRQAAPAVVDNAIDGSIGLVATSELPIRSLAAVDAATGRLTSYLPATASSLASSLPSTTPAQPGAAGSDEKLATSVLRSLAAYLADRHGYAGQPLAAGAAAIDLLRQLADLLRQQDATIADLRSQLATAAAAGSELAAVRTIFNRARATDRQYIGVDDSESLAIQIGRYFIWLDQQQRAAINAAVSVPAQPSAAGQLARLDFWLASHAMDLVGIEPGMDTAAACCAMLDTLLADNQAKDAAYWNLKASIKASSAGAASTTASADMDIAIP